MKLRHIVMFHLLDGIAADDERVRAACRAEEELTGVSGDHGWVFGPDLSRRDISADFAGMGDFDSTAQLDDFLAHPAHVAAAAAWAGLVRVTVADIEVES